MTSWTFGRKIATGFAMTSVLLVLIGFISYSSIASLITTSYAVTRTERVIQKLDELLSAMKDAETGQRGYLLTGDESYLEPYQVAREAQPALVRELRELTADRTAQARRVDELDSISQAKFTELRHTIDLRRSGRLDDALKIVTSGDGKKLMDDLRRVHGEMQREESDLLRARADESQSTADRARAAIVTGTIACLLLAAVAGYLIIRALGRDIGSSVAQVRSSSSELQAVATQQASGAREQATAVTEVVTTISELVATSRQIAESAQRVAQIAEQTASAARAGDTVVDRGQEQIGSIRRQMEQVVSQMLDLGRKSQEIGGVIDVVAELAEQTNILAINATIEANGAGDAGRRFAAVADEIRKLADRVAASTKGIRAQIEQIRGAANTTVMATESGAKAVEGGTRQFGDVATAFKQIVALVATTTDAAREIELSTKQQATAAEQVRVAMNDVARATRESESSTSQTLQTASQLAGLSTELQRLIQAPAR